MGSAASSVLFGVTAAEAVRRSCGLCAGGCRELLLEAPNRLANDVGCSALPASPGCGLSGDAAGLLEPLKQPCEDSSSGAG